MPDQVPGPPGPGRERFKAFISYSRAASGPLAIDLQTGIERFAKPWYRLRGLRIFRDDASMSANTALWSTIENGLSQAEWFILLATPEAAASEWVTQELDWWLRHRGPHQLLIVQAGGELYWDRRLGMFHEASTAIPPILRRAYPEEPRWIDLRWYAADPQRGRGDPRFTERVADLAAALRGVDRDTLVGENVRQHRRALRLARTGVSVLAVLLVLSIVAGVIAVGQRNAAVSQARISQARQLAATARSLIGSDVGQARLLAVEAYRLVPEQQSEATLLDAITSSPQLRREFDAGSDVTSTAATVDGQRVFAATAAGEVLSWDVESGERTELGRLDEAVRSIQVSVDGKVLATTAGDRTLVWVDGQPATLPESLPTDPVQVGVSPTGDTVVVAYGDRAMAYVLRRDNRSFTLDPTALTFSNQVMSLAVPDDASVVAQLFDDANTDTTGFVERRRLADGELVSQGRGGEGSDKLENALSPEGGFFAVPQFGNSGRMEIFRADRDHRGAEAAPELVGYVSQVKDPRVALSPGATWSAYAEDDVISVARTQPPGATTPFAVTELRGIEQTGVNTLNFAGDRFLMSGSGHRVLLWDLQQDTRIVQHVAAPVPDVANADVSRRIVPNGSGTRVADLDSVGGFTVTDVATGQVVTASDTSRFLDWRDDDHLYYADSADRALHLFDLVSGRNVARLPLDWVNLPGSERLDLWSARYLQGQEELLLAGRNRIGRMDLTSGAVQVLRTDLHFPTFAADGAHAFGVPNPDDPRGVVADLTGGPDWSVPTVGPLWLDATSAVAAGFTASGFEGDVLVTEAEDADRVLWSVDDHRQLGTATGSDDFPTFRIAVAPDGRQVAVHRNDGTIELSEVHSGRALGRVPLVREERKASYAYAGDGARLIVVSPESSTDDGTTAYVMSIDLRPDAWVAAACDSVDRDLTAEEWQTLTGTKAPEDLRCQ